ncbi:uncharacterized protein LOC126367766 [Pectinophora gossypiella]|nr:uncharacterized protein LOC126367766 [Pectinophora gossypiella]
MKFIFNMERVLLTVTGVLCTILVLKLFYSLRTILLWRVNCWFCNNNFWVKLPERNSWTCPKCDQYNGFTKDGDYNKPLFAVNEQNHKTPKVFHSSPPRNGLCKMCNINQQLKVAQLANFVPMNDRNFDEEIDSYRMQLEKAYRLCSPCKKVLQTKLHKEKEVLLGTKLLETRSPDKKGYKIEMQNRRLQGFINNTSMYLAGLLLILVSVECYSNIRKDKSLSSTVTNIKDVVYGLLVRILSIIKMKMLMTFPVLENYLVDVHNIIHLDKWPKRLTFTYDKVKGYNILTQEALGGFVCLIQIIGHVWSVNKLKFTVATDLLWSIFVITSIAHHSVAVDPTIMSLVKLFSMLAVLFVYRRMKPKSIRRQNATKVTPAPKNMKNLTNCTMIDEDDSMETDDDVSLSQFGLHNFTESSNETIGPLNNSLIGGRSFTPRSNDSIWTKPKLNSTFCVNPVLKSPSSVSDTVFAKPSYQKMSKDNSFKKYQNLTKDDSDSDLDESISSLCIGSPKKSKQNGSIFSLRKFTATPNFVAPTPLARSRPLISPSKLGHSTSWVAGGYWGTEGERQIFNINGSRSSSQSSGFESQASSMNQRPVFSQPPSREESVCGEPDRNTLMDRFSNCSMSNFGSYQPQTPSHFSRVSSPVFPQMQYNSHVHIPQPRFAQQNVPNVFVQQQFGSSQSMFKTPGGSGLIKLPQVNPFAPR